MDKAYLKDEEPHVNFRDKTGVNGDGGDIEDMVTRSSCLSSSFKRWTARCSVPPATTPTTVSIPIISTSRKKSFLATSASKSQSQRLKNRPKPTRFDPVKALVSPSTTQVELSMQPKLNSNNYEESLREGQIQETGDNFFLQISKFFPNEHQEVRAVDCSTFARSLLEANVNSNNSTPLSTSPHTSRRTGSNINSGNRSSSSDNGSNSKGESDLLERSRSLGQPIASTDVFLMKRSETPIRQNQRVNANAASSASAQHSQRVDANVASSTSAQQSQRVDANVASSANSNKKSGKKDESGKMIRSGKKKERSATEKMLRIKKNIVRDRNNNSISADFENPSNNDNSTGLERSSSESNSHITIDTSSIVKKNMHTQTIVLPKKHVQIQRSSFSRNPKVPLTVQYL